MAGTLNIRTGTKLQLALEDPSVPEPVFNLICTFARALDESAFLVSIPMKNGVALPLDESQKLLFQYGTEDDKMIMAGYADDLVKDGIRKYWKIRRVSEQRQFFKRADERLKVALRVELYQETWFKNDDGEIEKEEGMSLDISSGGMALYINRRFEVGEMCQMTLPRISADPEGQRIDDIVSLVCWLREAPKGSLYRNVCGLQFRFADGTEREQLKAYTSCVKKKYKL